MEIKYSFTISVSAFCPAPPRIPNFNRKASTTTTHLSSSSCTETQQDRKADMNTVHRFSEIAILETSSESGLKALQELFQLCQQRLPYVFEESKEPTENAMNENADGVSFIRKWKSLFSSDDIAAIKTQIQRMEERGWWSTNPDSVDGLPSFHLNLVSNGKPLFPIQGESAEDDFERGVQELLQLVHPMIYDDLLPKLQQEWLATKASTSLQVSDIFVRRYGRDLEDAGIQARQGISAHYDVYSKVTAVVALDDVAAKGTNGLYTTTNSLSTNHVALRRFVPLQEGDAVMHTWDILHGVDVEPGLDRTSLIVWFTEASVLDEADPEGDKKATESTVSPWLLRHPNLESDDVAQFVLASALSSSNADKDTNEKEQHEKDYQQELYLQSAATGNSFALTRVGSLIEEGVLGPELLEQAERIANQLRSVETLPVPMQKWQIGNENSLLAMRFWLEGAVRGNPLAQKALADELMFLQSSQPDHDTEVNTLAATLFALAAQQGDEEASDSLTRVIDVAVQNAKVQSQKEFLALDAVQVAQAANSS